MSSLSLFIHNLKITLRGWFKISTFLDFVELLMIILVIAIVLYNYVGSKLAG